MTDANGEAGLTDKGSKYTFTMPGAKVTVKAAFKAAEHVPAENSQTWTWRLVPRAVDYVLEKGA